MNYRPKCNDTQFMAGLLVGAIQGQTPADFAEQEVRCLKCGFCRDGWPLRDDGQHELFGAVVPCEANTEEA